MSTKAEEQNMKNTNEFINKKLIKEAFECIQKIEALLKSVDERLALTQKDAA